jgi:predicted dinucleotide-binding enzyme
MKQKVAVLGSGAVGQTLANGLKELGYAVTIGRREAKPVKNWVGPVETFEAAAENAEIVVVAVKGAVAEELISSIKPQLSGKTVIDTTNPIADKPPVDGVLSYFTTFDESLMERLQQLVPEAHFVKAFNSVGSGHMVNPDFQDGKPSMFICGNDAAAKQTTRDILDKFGWQTEDMGTATAARAIEPLCMLWCIPGMLQGEWSHAFKLLH